MKSPLKQEPEMIQSLSLGNHKDRKRERQFYLQKIKHDKILEKLILPKRGKKYLNYLASITCNSKLASHKRNKFLISIAKKKEKKKQNYSSYGTNVHSIFN